MPASDHDTQDTPDPPLPVPRFKRRKTAHTKRARADEAHGDVPVTVPATATDETRLDAPTPATLPAQLSDVEDEEGVPGLREALRRRKRVREQWGRGGAVVENGGREVVGREDGKGAGGAGLKYASRFVKQTGQVVDTGDREMTAYIEARLAEQHHAQYGTPIPAHLAALVGANNTNTNRNTASTASTTTSTTNDPAPKPPQATTTTASTTAARHGKLEEVPLPTPPSQPPNHSTPAPRIRLRRDGTPFPPRRQRRTSADLRRDALVESILSESRIEYFAPPASGSAHNTAASETPLTEEQMLQQFEDEYRDAAEARRPNPLPPAGKGGGAGDAAKGPKLGGSRSARAAMAAREKEKDKSNPNSGLKR